MTLDEAIKGSPVSLVNWVSCQERMPTLEFDGELAEFRAVVWRRGQPPEEALYVCWRDGKNTYHEDWKTPHWELPNRTDLHWEPTHWAAWPCGPMGPEGDV